jgi:hypothetical protein
MRVGRAGAAVALRLRDRRGAPPYHLTILLLAGALAPGVCGQKARFARWREECTLSVPAVASVSSRAGGRRLNPLPRPARALGARLQPLPPAGAGLVRPARGRCEHDTGYVGAAATERRCGFPARAQVSSYRRHHCVTCAGGREGASYRRAWDLTVALEPAAAARSGRPRRKDGASGNGSGPTLGGIMCARLGQGSGRFGARPTGRPMLPGCWKTPAA